MKDCSACGKRQPLEDFYVNRASEDGRMARCKACVKAYAVAKRIKDNASKPEDWKKKTADAAAYRREWMAAHPGYNTQRRKEWAKKNPERAAAIERRKYERRMQRLRGEGYVVGAPENRSGGRESLLTPEELSRRTKTRKETRRAIKKGLLVRGPCRECGSSETEAHHEDYSKPMDIVWLCPTHHRELHRQRAS